MIKVWGPLFSLLLSFSAMADGLLWDANFFQNSDRLDPNITQAKAIVVVHSTLGKCAGFFVANRDQKLFIGTARHCSGYNLTEACTNNLIRVETPDGTFNGTCSRVVLSNQASDFAIFEASFENEAELRRNIRFLSLSTQTPPVCAPLAMMGFPGDPTTETHEGREGRFTLSRNCWITDGSSPLDGSRVTAEVLEGSRRENERRNTVADEYTRLRSFIRTANGAQHNCDVYGGNSGGPMIYGGSTIVAGLPGGFWPGLFEEQPSNMSLGMETMALIFQMPDLLLQAQAEKISFSNPPSYRNRQCQTEIQSRRDI